MERSDIRGVAWQSRPGFRSAQSGYSVIHLTERAARRAKISPSTRPICRVDFAMESAMLAKAIFAVAAAVMVGLAAFAPPEAAAKGDRPMMSGTVGTSVGRIKL